MPWQLRQQLTLQKGAAAGSTVNVAADRAYLIEKAFDADLNPGLWLVWRKGSVLNPTNAPSPLFFSEREFQFVYTRFQNWRAPAVNPPQAFQFYVPETSRFQEVSVILYEFI